MYEVNIYLKVRHYCITEGHSDRSASKHFGLNRRTIKKMRLCPIPPERKAPTVTRSLVLDDCTEAINKYLEENKLSHHKQKMTSKIIYQRLLDEHNYTGSYRTVSRAICKLTLRNKEVYIPLEFAFGTAQADFGEFYAIIADVYIKVYYFCLSMRNSNKIFVKCYFSEDSLAWCDGHVAAFIYFGGVPLIILYDNSTRLVKKIETNGVRQLTTKFTELQSHYLFKPSFARPARGNEKGNVENNIGWIRSNIFSPTPKFDSIEDLNEYVLKRCDQRALQTSGHKTQSIAEEFEKERSALLALPNDNYDCFIRPLRKPLHF